MCVVLRYHLEQAIQAASEESLKAACSEKDAESYKQVGKSTLESASMDLRKWHSNLASLNDEETHVSKVLGITWDSRSDKLSFPVKTIVSSSLTKRNASCCML